MPHITVGTVKVYGVTTGHRIKVLPDAPTLAKQGLKGFDAVVWHGIYAAKHTPKEATEKFASALRAALNDPVVVQRMGDLGAKFVPDSKRTHDGLRTQLKAETER